MNGYDEAEREIAHWRWRDDVTGEETEGEAWEYWQARATAAETHLHLIAELEPASPATEFDSNLLSADDANKLLGEVFRLARIALSGHNAKRSKRQAWDQLEKLAREIDPSLPADLSGYDLRITLNKNFQSVELFPDSAAWPRTTHSTGK